MPRVHGTVRFFNDVKGYGFIAPHDGSGDVFVHRTSLGQSCLQVKNGLSRFILYPDQEVSYELVDSVAGKGSGKKANYVELVSK
jgi:CspA family cold shock protein